MRRCVNDIKHLLLPEGEGGDPTGDDYDRVTLQSDHGEVASGRNYADQDFYEVDW